MATFFDAITEKQHIRIEQQKLFFVATAPREGRVNVSPKGMDTFRILTPNRVVYLDLTGSGNETSAHLLDNGRITVMFCAFEGKPLIIRLFGRGRVITQTDEEWADFAPLLPNLPGIRQIMIIDVEQTQNSCGTSVPLFDFREERTQLIETWQSRGEDGVRKYWKERNTKSIDGLPVHDLTKDT